MKFYNNILNSLEVTKRTRLSGKFRYFPFQRIIANPELRVLWSANLLMLIDIRMKFHHGIQETERTRLKCLFGYFRFQRVITRKICNPELQFLCSAHRLMLINKLMKFHDNNLKPFSSYRANTTRKQILLFSISKVNNSKYTQSRVMVLVFCTSDLMLFNNPVKFHQNVLNESQVTERKRFVTD